MITTVWGVVHNGKVDLPQNGAFTEGDRVLVTVLPPEDDSAFWRAAGESSLEAVWNNPQDDAYAQLLQK